MWVLPSPSLKCSSFLFFPDYRNTTFSIQNVDIREILNTEYEGSSSECVLPSRECPNSSPRSTPYPLFVTLCKCPSYSATLVLICKMEMGSVEWSVWSSARHKYHACVSCNYRLQLPSGTVTSYHSGHMPPISFYIWLNIQKIGSRYTHCFVTCLFHIAVYLSTSIYMDLPNPFKWIYSNLLNAYMT